jgi:hypothetical protein
MQIHPTKVALKAAKQSAKERRLIQVTAKMGGLTTERITE